VFIYTQLFIAKNVISIDTKPENKIMNTHADKSRENKSQTVSHGESQKRSSGESTFQFVDNRPETVAQRKLQEIANNSPQVSQLRAFQDMANNSPQAKETAQMQSMEDNHSAKQRQPIQKKENNTGLPDTLKTGMENLSGMSLDDVKVHRNSDKPAQLQAHAYAQGTDIHLGTGQEKHLPHEAWHVVQQKQGRVQPTMQMKGKVNVNDDARLEKEADVMGTKSLTNNVPYDVQLTNFSSSSSVHQLQQPEKMAMAERANPDKPSPLKGLLDGYEEDEALFGNENDNANQDPDLIASREQVAFFKRTMEYHLEETTRLQDIVLKAESSVGDSRTSALIGAGIADLGIGIASLATLGASNVFTAPASIGIKAGRKKVMQSIDAERLGPQAKKSEKGKKPGVMDKAKSKLDEGKKRKDQAKLAQSAAAYHDLAFGAEESANVSEGFTGGIKETGKAIGAGAIEAIKDITPDLIKEATPIIGGIFKITKAIYGLSKIPELIESLVINGFRDDLIMTKVFLEGTIDSLEKNIDQAKFLSSKNALQKALKNMKNLQKGFLHLEKAITVNVGAIGNAGNYLKKKTGKGKESTGTELPTSRSRSETVLSKEGNN
jgi:hypothetical protein